MTHIMTEKGVEWITNKGNVLCVERVPYKDGGGNIMGMSDMYRGNSNYFSASSIGYRPQYYIEIICMGCGNRDRISEGSICGTCQRCGRSDGWEKYDMYNQQQACVRNEMPMAVPVTMPDGNKSKVEVKKSVSVNPLGLLILSGIGFLGYKIINRELNKNAK